MRQVVDRNEVLQCTLRDREMNYFLRRQSPIKPSKPEPNNHSAEGSGTALILLWGTKLALSVNDISNVFAASAVPCAADCAKRLAHR